MPLALLLMLVNVQCIMAARRSLYSGTPLRPVDIYSGQSASAILTGVGVYLFTLTSKRFSLGNKRDSIRPERRRGLLRPVYASLTLVGTAKHD